MLTDLLNEIDRDKIAKIVQERGFEPEAWVRFLGTDAVEIDGDLSLDELKVLVEIMEAIR